MALVEGSLVIEIVLIIVFVIAGVYIWNSVKSIEGRIIGAAFLLVALLIALVIAGII